MDILLTEESRSDTHRHQSYDEAGNLPRRFCNATFKSDGRRFTLHSFLSSPIDLHSSAPQQSAIRARDISAAGCKSAGAGPLQNASPIEHSRCVEETPIP